MTSNLLWKSESSEFKAKKKEKRKEQEEEKLESFKYSRSTQKHHNVFSLGCRIPYSFKFYSPNFILQVTAFRIIYHPLSLLLLRFPFQFHKRLFTLPDEPSGSSKVNLHAPKS